MLEANTYVGRLDTTARASEAVAAGWAALAVVIILVAREPVALFAPQLWAEDGPVFLGQALRLGWIGLPESYAGYLLVLQRAVTNLIVPLVPLELVPLAMNVAAILFTGVAAYVVATARVPVAHRWVYAVAMVLVPHDGEVFATITNFQWFLGIVLFTLVLQTPAASSRDRLRDSSIALVCGLSSPFAVLVAPFLVVRYVFVVRPTKYDLLAFAIVIGTAIATVAMFVMTPSRGNLGGYLEFPGLAISSVLGFLLSAGIGQLISLPIETIPNYIAGLVIGVGIVIAVARPAFAWFRGRGNEGVAAAAVVAYALALVMLTFLREPLWRLHTIGPHADFATGARYLFGPHVLLVWLLIYIAINATDYLRKAAMVVLSLILVTVAIQFQAAPIGYIDWPKQVSQVGHDWQRVEVMPTWSMNVCRYPCAPTTP